MIMCDICSVLFFVVLGSSIYMPKLNERERWSGSKLVLKFKDLHTTLQVHA